MAAEFSRFFVLLATLSMLGTKMAALPDRFDHPEAAEKESDLARLSQRHVIKKCTPMENITLCTGHCPTDACFDLAVPGTCLRLFRVAEAYQIAKAMCEEAAGHLYTMNTLQKRRILLSFMEREGLAADTQLWLDGDDEDEEGRWVLTGGAVLPLTSPLWSPGQPAGQRSQNCLATYGALLNDMPCAASRQYICELSISPRYTC